MQNKFIVSCKQIIEKYPHYLLSAVVFLFYINFVPDFFQGDDWLWLANAKRLMLNPDLFFDRPIYGYFRPLYMLYISLCYKLFGLNALAFGLTNLLIHVINCSLLYKVLIKYDFEKRIAIAASFIFGFHFLTSPAVCWISSGSDLIVLMLLLIFSIKLPDYYKKPDMKKLVMLIIIGFGSFLVKETGFVSLGLFFLYPILIKKNPLSKELRRGSIILTFTYLIYLSWYFSARTVINKELVFSFGLFINLWYLVSYMFMPLSKRIVEMFGNELSSYLSILKIITTVVIPVGGIMLILKNLGQKRYFILWPLVVLLPVSLFDWNLSLFSLYPQMTASRFMYIPLPGLAVFMALIMGSVFIRLPAKKVSSVILASLYVVASFMIINKIVFLYETRQQQNSIIFNALNTQSELISKADNLVISSGSNGGYIEQELIGHKEIIEDICFLITGKEIAFSHLSESGEEFKFVEGENFTFLIWNSELKKFIPISD